MYPRPREKVLKSTTEAAERRLSELNYQFVEEFAHLPISVSLEENERIIRGLFEDCSDVAIRSFKIEQNIPAMAVFIDGLAKTEEVNQALKSLMILEGGASRIDAIQSTTLPVSQIQKATNYMDFLLSILGGDTGILVDQDSSALLLGIRGANTRSISEPETESVIRGPREGFIENLRTNTSMLRRKIKSPRLKMKSQTIGKQTNTSIVIAYMEGICDPALVEEIEKRLEKIDTDSIFESGYIEEYIQDSSYSPFPQLQYSERPDAVALAMVNGRIAIFVDGTPMVLLAPAVFWDFMQASEDLYERFQIGTLLRWLRYLFLIISLFTPALYVAIITFHQEMLPTSLLLSVAAAREAIPFPAVVEALLLEVTFEALREAGIRLPKTIGQAVSILGALVVGQAAVEAGIVSAPMVIVVSLTGIASFTIPRFNGAIAIRMLRFPITIAASVFGLFGIILASMAILGHMANLRSFGVPYLSPSAPLSISDLKSILVRKPHWANRKRYAYLSVMDTVRTGDALTDEILHQHGQKGMNIEHERKSEGS
jgi:spore germination protein